jgi:hypothetical protein
MADERLFILHDRVPVADLVLVCNGTANDALVARVGDRRAGREIMLYQLRTHNIGQNADPNADPEDHPDDVKVLPITIRVGKHHVARTHAAGGWRYAHMRAVASHPLVRRLELRRGHRIAIVDSERAAEFRAQLQEVPILIPARNSNMVGNVALRFDLEFETTPPVVRVRDVFSRPMGSMGAGQPVGTANLQVWFEAEFPGYEVDMTSARVALVQNAEYADE